jgi:hypothetical protein
MYIMLAYAEAVKTNVDAAAGNSQDMIKAGQMKRR